MTAILARFEKQPSEIQDYDIDYTDYLDGLADTADTASVVVETGIDLLGSAVIGKTVKVWLSGGSDGVTYKVTVRLSTTGGRVREADIKVKVKEA